MLNGTLGGVSMTESQGCLVVSVPDSMVDEAFDQFYQAVSQRLVQSRMPALILDFSGVSILDLLEFERIQKLARVAGFLGAQACCVALNAGISAFLAEAGCELEGMHFCMHMEEAFDQVGSGG